MAQTFFAGVAGLAVLFHEETKNITKNDYISIFTASFFHIVIRHDLYGSFEADS